MGWQDVLIDKAVAVALENPRLSGFLAPWMLRSWVSRVLTPQLGFSNLYPGDTLEVAISLTLDGLGGPSEFGQIVLKATVGASQMLLFDSATYVEPARWSGSVAPVPLPDRSLAESFPVSRVRLIDLE